MTKLQPDQPCVTDRWLNELKAQLTVAGDAYLRCAGNESADVEHPVHPGIRLNRTSLAMLAVGTVMDKLAELPGMRENPGLAPLHDLIAALWDLGRGGQPSLFQPIPGIGNGGERIAQRWTRQHALLFVALLEGAGMKGRSACRLVAQALADQGHTGRKRHDGPRPLSEGTVVDWRNRSRQRDFKQRDPEVARFLERNLARVRHSPDWPFSTEQAVELVKQMVTSPLVRSKSD